METTQERLWDSFMSDMSVVKELNAIRMKKVLMEDIYDEIFRHCKVEKRTFYSPTIDNSVGYREVYSEAKIALYTGFRKIKIMWATARYGIPTLKIGLESEDDWFALRRTLQLANLVRDTKLHYFEG